MPNEIKNEIAPDSRPDSKPAAAGDLSEAIKATIGREIGEEVRCVRVFDDKYRCNWWVKDKEGPAFMNVGKIIKSKFLRATLTNAKLVIEDLSPASGK